MTRPDIWAVVPVKDFDRAKTRLAEVLAPAERQALARAMLSDVLDAVLAAERLAGVVVVTRDPDAMKMAVAAGARILEESSNQGPNPAVAAAARLLAAEGRAGMLSMVSDIPLTTPGEIERILYAHGSAPAVTLVPSRKGSGTNAVACSPVDGLRPSYGGHSLSAHLNLARQQGIKPNILRLRGVALDIDGAADLAAFLGHDPSNRTARYLRESGIAGRLAGTVRFGMPQAAPA